MYFGYQCFLRVSFEQIHRYRDSKEAAKASKVGEFCFE